MSASRRSEDGASFAPDSLEPWPTASLRLHRVIRVHWVSPSATTSPSPARPAATASPSYPLPEPSERPDARPAAVSALLKQRVLAAMRQHCDIPMKELANAFPVACGFYNDRAVFHMHVQEECAPSKFEKLCPFKNVYAAVSAINARSPDAVVALENLRVKFQQSYGKHSTVCFVFGATAEYRQKHANNTTFIPVPDDVPLEAFVGRAMRTLAESMVSFIARRLKGLTASTVKDGDQFVTALEKRKFFEVENEREVLRLVQQRAAKHRADLLLLLGATEPALQALALAGGAAPSAWTASSLETLAALRYEEYRATLDQWDACGRSMEVLAFGGRESVGRAAGGEPSARLGGGGGRGGGGAASASSASTHPCVTRSLSDDVDDVADAAPFSSEWGGSTFYSTTTTTTGDASIGGLLPVSAGHSSSGSAGGGPAGLLLGLESTAATMLNRFSLALPAAEAFLMAGGAKTGITAELRPVVESATRTFRSAVATVLRMYPSNAPTAALVRTFLNDGSSAGGDLDAATVSLSASMVQITGGDEDKVRSERLRRWSDLSDAFDALLAAWHRELECYLIEASQRYRAATAESPSALLATSLQVESLLKVAHLRASTRDKSGLLDCLRDIQQLLPRFPWLVGQRIQRHLPRLCWHCGCTRKAVLLQRTVALADLERQLVSTALRGLALAAEWSGVSLQLADTDGLLSVRSAATTTAAMTTTLKGGSEDSAAQLLGSGVVGGTASAAQSGGDRIRGEGSGAALSSSTTASHQIQVNLLLDLVSAAKTLRDMSGNASLCYSLASYVLLTCQPWLPREMTQWLVEVLSVSFPTVSPDMRLNTVTLPVLRQLLPLPIESHLIPQMVYVGGPRFDYSPKPDCLWLRGRYLAANTPIWVVDTPGCIQLVLYNPFSFELLLHSVRLICRHVPAPSATAGSTSDGGAPTGAIASVPSSQTAMRSAPPLLSASTSFSSFAFIAPRSGRGGGERGCNDDDDRAAYAVCVVSLAPREERRLFAYVKPRVVGEVIVEGAEVGWQPVAFGEAVSGAEARTGRTVATAAASAAAVSSQPTASSAGATTAAATLSTSGGPIPPPFAIATAMGSSTCSSSAFGGGGGGSSCAGAPNSSPSSSKSSTFPTAANTTTVVTGAQRGPHVAPIIITQFIPVPRPAPAPIPVIDVLPLVVCELSSSRIELFAGQTVTFCVVVTNAGKLPVTEMSVTFHKGACRVKDCTGCRTWVGPSGGGGGGGREPAKSVSVQDAPSVSYDRGFIASLLPFEEGMSTALDATLHPPPRASGGTPTASPPANGIVAVTSGGRAPKPATGSPASSSGAGGVASGTTMGAAAAGAAAAPSGVTAAGGGQHSIIMVRTTYGSRIVIPPRLQDARGPTATPISRRVSNSALSVTLLPGLFVTSIRLSPDRRSIEVRLVNEALRHTFALAAGATATPGGQNVAFSAAATASIRLRPGDQSVLIFSIARLPEGISGVALAWTVEPDVSSATGSSEGSPFDTLTELPAGAVRSQSPPQPQASRGATGHDAHGRVLGGDSAHRTTLAVSGATSVDFSLVLRDACCTEPLEDVHVDVTFAVVHRDDAVSLLRRTQADPVMMLVRGVTTSATGGFASLDPAAPGVHWISHPLSLMTALPAVVRGSGKKAEGVGDQPRQAQHTDRGTSDDALAVPASREGVSEGVLGGRPNVAGALRRQRALSSLGLTRRVHPASGNSGGLSFGAGSAVTSGAAHLTTPPQQVAGRRGSDPSQRHRGQTRNGEGGGDGGNSPENPDPLASTYTSARQAVAAAFAPSIGRAVGGVSGVGGRAASPPCRSVAGRDPIVLPAIRPVRGRIMVRAPWKPVPLTVSIAFEDPSGAFIAGPMRVKCVVGSPDPANSPREENMAERVFHGTFELTLFATGEHNLRVTIEDRYQRTITYALRLVAEHGGGGFFTLGDESSSSSDENDGGDSDEDGHGSDHGNGFVEGGDGVAARSLGIDSEHGRAVVSAPT